MSLLYPYGWRGRRYPLAVIATFPSVKLLDPEMRRRVFAMMTAAGKAKRTLGIGVAWRSSETQLKGFIDRHDVVATGGCCQYQGKRYALKPHRAHMAPPGRSYHETTTPAGQALAVDMVGDLRWMNANASRFGIQHFADLGEAWHCQPHELPRSRSGYKPSMHPLKEYTLPDA